MGNREVWQEGPLLLCPSEGLLGLGFFSLASVKNGSCKLLSEDPRVRVSVTAVWARCPRAWCPDRVAMLPGPPASSTTCLGAPASGPTPPLLQGTASCDTPVPASPDCPSPPQGTGSGHRCHCSPRSQSADLHHEWLPLSQGEDMAVWLHRVGVMLTTCAQNYPGW